LAKNLDKLKLFAQVLLDTEDDIPGRTMADVFEQLADEYTPGEATVTDDSITNAKINSAAGIVGTKLSAAVQASLAKADTALQSDDIRIPAGTPTNAAAASIVMTIDGVAIDGETVSIGDDVYEFCADAAQSLTAGSTIAVDITAVCTASQGSLTVAELPAIGDFFTIGTKVYTIVPIGTANGDGDVEFGILSAIQANVVAAINGNDGHNEPSEFVTAAEAVAGVIVVTALVGGVAGDAIIFTENLSGVTNTIDGAGTLGATTPGADCTKADARTALLAAITESDTGVGAAAGDGDTMTLTADALGVAGNEIAVSSTGANIEFAAAATSLAGGSAGTVGAAGQKYFDATYEYICIATNDENGANWRRKANGSVYY